MKSVPRCAGKVPAVLSSLACVMTLAHSTGCKTRSYNAEAKQDGDNAKEGRVPCSFPEDGDMLRRGPQWREIRAWEW